MLIFFKNYSTDLGLKSAALLPEVLADSEWGSSYEAHHTAFNKYTGFPGKMFEYFEVRRSQDWGFTSSNV